MSEQDPAQELDEARRQEIFQALVEAQDLHEFTVPQSRSLIAHRFGISEDHVRRIEREGLDRLWPPL
jgi:hypothetical protein